jgi:hypothetical protein
LHGKRFGFGLIGINSPDFGIPENEVGVLLATASRQQYQYEKAQQMAHLLPP